MDIHLGVLDRSRLDELYALHRETLDTLPSRSFLYERDRAFFDRVVNSDGVVVGALTAMGELVAYAALLSPNKAPSPYTAALDRLEIDGSVVAIGGGYGVHPGYRRRGLTRKIMIERFSQAARLGARFAVDVVFPDNEVSLIALHGLGFAAIGVHVDDDGDNYLLLSSTTSPFPRGLPVERQLGLLDHAQNITALRYGGLVGLPAQDEGIPVLHYVQPKQVFVAGQMVNSRK